MNTMQQASHELVVVLCSDACADTQTRAKLFASKQGVPLVSSEGSHSADYELVFGAQPVYLKQTGKGAPGPISAAFDDGKSTHRRIYGGGKGQLIAKAVGLKKGANPRVLDATAGLGRDAFVLASLGCSVQMFEREPVVAEMLLSALSYASASTDAELTAIAQRMSLMHESAAAWLTMQSGYVADVIYLDPMYPTRDKSAAVKKEMRAFHDLVGHNEDDHELLAAALEKAQYRVVVKRPRKGDAIKGPKPSMQVCGKSSRYDIYTIKSLSYLKGSEG
jgi:16S rRNA (guanine1516-N2)-methyltransferase